jgi:hypothetical protein
MQRKIKLYLKGLRRGVEEEILGMHKADLRGDHVFKDATPFTTPPSSKRSPVWFSERIRSSYDIRRNDLKHTGKISYKEMTW